MKSILVIDTLEFKCPYCENTDISTIGAEGYDNICSDCGRMFEDEEFLITLNGLPLTPRTPLIPIDIKDLEISIKEIEGEYDISGFHIRNKSTHNKVLKPIKDLITKLGGNKK